MVESVHSHDDYKEEADALAADDQLVSDDEEHDIL